MRNDGEEPGWSWKGTAEEGADPIHGIHDQIFKEYKVYKISGVISVFFFLSQFLFFFISSSLHLNGSKYVLLSPLPLLA